jgi:hypothetical protein
MIKQLLNNEIVVKQLEAVAEELEVMKESKGDFTFFLPKLIMNIEALLKMYHFNGSNTFDYAYTFENTKEEKIALQEDKKQKFEIIQKGEEEYNKALEEYNKAMDKALEEYNKAMELYKSIEEIDNKLLVIEQNIAEPEWKVWKEGHEMVAFDTVKKFLK